MVYTAGQVCSDWVSLGVEQAILPLAEVQTLAERKSKLRSVWARCVLAAFLGHSPHPLPTEFLNPPLEFPEGHRDKDTSCSNEVILDS